MKRLLMIAATAGLALSLGACNGGSGSGVGGVTDASPGLGQTPAPTPTPAPSSSASATTMEFSAFVNNQMAPGVRTSETALPVDVNTLKFKFDDNNNPHAFDAIVSQSKSTGSGG